MGSEKPVWCVQPSVKEMYPYLNEKLKILENKENILLKKIFEVISKCCHQIKYMLRTVESNFKNPDVA